MSRSMAPLPFTWAKSLTLLSRAFAILGVPLLRDAISAAALSFMATFIIEADLLTIPLRTGAS